MNKNQWFKVISKSTLVSTLVGFVTISQAQEFDMWDNLNGNLGALSRENRAKEHPPHAFDITGTWQIDLSTWQFEPPEGLKPEYKEMYQATLDAAAEGKVLYGDVGLCWPPGVPTMMNRVWPINMISLSTSIVMIANFENQVRWIFMDGREHTDPEIYVPSYNGESIGYWEGDTLVIDTKNYESKRHWITAGIPVSDDFHTVERVTMSNDGNTLEIEFTMTDPNIWDGEWVSTKVYSLTDKVDFLEVHCLPDLNDGIPATFDEYRVDE